MRQIEYTKDMVEFLREGYKKMTVKDLTEAFNQKFNQNRTVPAIATKLVKSKIRCDRPYGKRLMPDRRLFTDEQIEFMEKNYKDLTQDEMTRIFNEHYNTNFTKDQIGAALARNKIVSGLNGFFKKGIEPWNKGVKGHIGANKTSFKKGNVPPNRKPLWTERIGKDGYIEMKVPEKNPYTGFSTRYKHKHIWIWEQHNNKKVPKGHAVIFKDSNNRNFDPDNLELVTRHELLRINQHGYKESPEEVKPVLITLAKVEAKTVEAKREL